MITHSLGTIKWHVCKTRHYINNIKKQLEKTGQTKKQNEEKITKRIETFCEKSPNPRCTCSTTYNICNKGKTNTPKKSYQKRININIQI